MIWVMSKMCFYFLAHSFILEFCGIFWNMIFTKCKNCMVTKSLEKNLDNNVTSAFIRHHMFLSGSSNAMKENNVILVS